MALLDRIVVEKWIAVMSVAIKEAEKRKKNLTEILSIMAKLPGWPGRVAWLLLIDQSRLALVLGWLKSGVKPNQALTKYLEDYIEHILS